MGRLHKILKIFSHVMTVLPLFHTIDIDDKIKNHPTTNNLQVSKVMLAKCKKLKAKMGVANRIVGSDYCCLLQVQCAPTK